MTNLIPFGGISNLFYIFIPGVFLLLNLVIAGYYSPFFSAGSSVKYAIENPTISVVIMIGFGYLTGLLLRLFRTGLADRISAWFLRKCFKRAKGGRNLNNLYAYERFPYNGWLEVLSERLHPEAKEFYQTVWKGKKTSTFFNYCKTMVISEDGRASGEIFVAESLCRSIASMLYALFIAVVIVLGVLILQLYNGNTVNMVLIVILIGYLCAIGVILLNFRFIRVKEVFTVFTTSYKNRHLF